MYVIDEETALEALDLVEQGEVVSYSDQFRYKGQVSDPEELFRLLMSGLQGDYFPIVVEVVEPLKPSAKKARTTIAVVDEATALQVLEMVEQGTPVLYSDQLRVGMRIDDPAVLMACLKRAWQQGSQDSKIRVEVE